MVIALVAGHLAAGALLSLRGPLIDFYPYYAAGALARHGLDFYEADLGQWPALAEQAGIRPPRPDEPPRFLYPPFAAVLFMPLSLLPEVPARAVWYGANLGLLGWSLLRLAAALELRPRSRPWLWWLVLGLSFGPVALTLFLAQINLLVLVLCVEGFVRLVQRRDASAGAALGLAAGLKLFPVLLLAYCAWRRRWRAAGAGALTVLLTIIAGWLLLGAGPSATFLADAFGGHREKLPGLPLNQSLLGLAALFMPAAGEPAWEVGWLIGASLIGLTGLWLAPPGGRPVSLRELGLVTTGVLLVTPISWVHYEVLLLPLIAALLFEPGRLRGPGPARWLGLLAWGAPTLYVVLWPFRGQLAGPPGAAVFSLGAWTMLLLWAHGAWTARSAAGRVKALAAGAETR